MEVIKAQIRQKHGETVPIEIPTDGEILRIAERLHERRAAELEEHSGWKALYLPRGKRRFTKIEVDPFTGKHGTATEDIAVSPAEFTFGYGGPWRIVLTWSNGDDAPPIWHRYEKDLIRSPNVITGSPF